MDNLALTFIEVLSATICFVLLRFMIKPYRTTGEGRYLGLPLGFGFLGVSYILAGVSLYFESFLLVNDIKWFQLFTQAYAFAFLAATYYFSKKPAKNTRLWWNITYAALVFAALISYLVVVEPPMFGLPSYKTADEYFRLFNIICLTYISIHTIRSHVSKPDPETIWIPFGYLLLGFGQYSSLIWSIDPSFSAYAGAYVLRLAGLLVFLYVSFRTFYGSRRQLQKEGSLNEEAPA
jgi:hypothetical protein